MNMVAIVTDEMHSVSDIDYLCAAALRRRAWRRNPGYSIVSTDELRHDAAFKRVVDAMTNVVRTTTLTGAHNFISCEDGQAACRPTTRLCGSWFMVYDETCDGCAVHADDGHVSAVVWLTPDDQMRDCDEQNALIVWDCHPPDDWSFEEYNGTPDDTAICKLLQDKNATRVPYAHNRSVVFPSMCFHKTENIACKSGSQRVTLSMVFEVV